MINETPNNETPQTPQSPQTPQPRKRQVRCAMCGLPITNPKEDTGQLIGIGHDEFGNEKELWEAVVCSPCGHGLIDDDPVKVALYDKLDKKMKRKLELKQNQTKPSSKGTSGTGSGDTKPLAPIIRPSVPSTPPVPPVSPVSSSSSSNFSQAARNRKKKTDTLFDSLVDVAVQYLKADPNDPNSGSKAYFEELRVGCVTQAYYAKVMLKARDFLSNRS